MILMFLQEITKCSSHFDDEEISTKGDHSDANAIDEFI